MKNIDVVLGPDSELSSVGRKLTAQGMAQYTNVQS